MYDTVVVLLDAEVLGVGCVAVIIFERVEEGRKKVRNFLDSKISDCFKPKHSYKLQEVKLSPLLSPTNCACDLSKDRMTGLTY